MSPRDQFASEVEDLTDRITTPGVVGWSVTQCHLPFAILRLANAASGRKEAEVLRSPRWPGVMMGKLKKLHATTSTECNYRQSEQGLHSLPLAPSSALAGAELPSSRESKPHIDARRPYGAKRLDLLDRDNQSRLGMGRTL